MLSKHQLSPHLAILIITIVGAAIALYVLRTIPAVEEYQSEDRVVELEKRITEDE